MGIHLTYLTILAYLSYFWLVKLAAFWGMPEADINHTINRLWNGFSIGNIDISLYNILSALAVLIGLIALNNIIKRSLGKALQNANKFSPGSRASITAAVGYVGIIIAITASIAVLGVNLTNIALIASGLTLGIGFGLQTIVSNFVSGLILLMERPVSIGDWVVVDGNEGIVSDIRFRATEIKTFDKASVLVPNSSFISNVVTNMTHQEQMLRIIIPVGVAYNSDVDQVESILLQCLEGITGILKVPEPNVFFMNFGESSLDFELRCFTNDALNSLKLASQLRFKINRAFKENNIVIPFPQRVIQMENTVQPLTPGQEPSHR